MLKLLSGHCRNPVGHHHHLHWGRLPGELHGQLDCLGHYVGAAEEFRLDGLMRLNTGIAVCDYDFHRGMTVGHHDLQAIIGGILYTIAQACKMMTISSGQF